jgi:hypothetical protein
MIRKNFSSARRNRTWRTKATTVSTKASARLASNNMFMWFLHVKTSRIGKYIRRSIDPIHRRIVR